MNDKRYSIKLSDGTVLDNLRKNGDNYISSAAVQEDIFTENCSPVVISDGETEETHAHMELVQITPVGDEFWFVLRDLSEDELEKMRLWAGLEYISMMTGVEL